MTSNSIGAAHPIGATVTTDGVNFSLFSRTATGVELLLFDEIDDVLPAHKITLDRVRNLTYHYWHTFLPGVRAGQLYGYHVQGPDDPSAGLHFDGSKVLLDPYGRGLVVPRDYRRETACRPGEQHAVAMKCVVVDPRDYDWEGDQPLRLSSARTVIYEMHVRGFTRRRTISGSGTPPRPYPAQPTWSQRDPWWS